MMKRYLSILLAAMLLVPTQAKIKVHGLGDSTATEQAETGTMRGWIQVLQQFFDKDKAEVVNHAKSGQSTKSFYNELWTTALDRVEAGDVVLISFAHNDENSATIDGDVLKAYYESLGTEEGAAAAAALSTRGTNPTTTYKAYLRLFVEETKAKGAYPVMVGPICRKMKSTDSSISPMGRHNLYQRFDTILNGVLVQNSSMETDDHSKDYIYQMQLVAAEYEGVPFIDLTTATEVYYNTFADNETVLANRIFCGTDGTHLGLMGATQAARDFAKLVKAQAVSETDASKKAVLQLLADAVTEVDKEVVFSPVSGDLGQCYTGHTLEKVFSASCFGLDNAEGDVSLAVTGGYELSIDGGENWSTMVNTTYDLSTLIQNIYVRITPAASGTVNGQLTVSVDGVNGALDLTAQAFQKASGSEMYVIYPLDEASVVARTNGYVTANGEVTEGIAYASLVGNTTWPDEKTVNARRYTVSGGWTAGEIDENPARYMQWSMTLNDDAGVSAVDIDSISMYIAGRGTQAMCAKIYYSTDPSFSQESSTNVVWFSTGMGNSGHYVVAKPVMKLQPGESIYIRVYPYRLNATTGDGGDIVMREVTIHGWSPDILPEYRELAQWDFRTKTGYNVTAGTGTTSYYTPNSETLSENISSTLSTIQPVVYPASYEGTQSAYEMTCLSNSGATWTIDKSGYFQYNTSGVTIGADADFTDPSKHKNYYQFAFSTVGYKNVTMTWSEKCSRNDATKSWAVHVAYSTDGGTTWTDCGEKALTNNAWAVLEETLPGGKANLLVRILPTLDWHYQLQYLTLTGEVKQAVSNWRDITIDLRQGQLGTSGNNLQKYLTINGEEYTYSDEAPSAYNALLSASNFNGTDHGYTYFKAAVPVETGIYKISLGTCAWGSNAVVKSKDESQTLPIVNEHGKTVSAVNQNNGTCYHQNTTDNVVSFWYQASEEDTIKIICGNYTPYFAMEKVASLPARKYAVTYVNDTEGAIGTVPEESYVEAGNSVTLPTNRTLYKAGYTLTGWSDGTTTYAIGETVTPEDDVTLTAVFTANQYGLDESLTELTVRWDFQRQNGAPSVQWQNRTDDFLVTQAVINGKSTDVKLDVNTNSGKFNNSAWNDWCQINEGTILSFPAMEGSTVKAYSMYEPKNNSDEKSSVDGTAYSAFENYVATYATTPSAGKSTMTIKGGSYYRYIDITYPANEALLPLKALTVDGVKMDGAIIAAINTPDGYEATFSDNIYTSLPEVEATLLDDSKVVGVPSGSGTARTYTITGDPYTFKLNVEGIHIYEPTGDEETVNIKQNEGTIENNVWSNGVYALNATRLDGYNQYFKMNGSDYYITVPADVVVKQLIFKECSNNYAGNNDRLLAVSSTDATTYIPTENKFYHDSEGAKYDLIVNIENHYAGGDILFSLPRTGQPMCWIQLTTVKSNPGTAPKKTDESVTIDDNHAVVAVTFDREIVNDVEATINAKTVKAQGGSTTLYFPVWDLNYSSNYTLSIPAGGAKDAYNNVTDAEIKVSVAIPAKVEVEPALYDYVVSNAEELIAALDAVEATNNNNKNAARKTIFLKNGDYDLGSSAETVRWVRAHNLSLIGESRDGVIIHGTSTGISNPVLNLRYWQGFYLQDLTVRNDFDFRIGEFKGVAVAIYGGDKTIMKNVRMLSNQDTQVTGDRVYHEDCEIHGTVDFICGGGDNFYYHTDLVLENRGGDVIAAPSTNASTKWGYVFDRCTIKAAEGATEVTEGGWTLGRPWQNEPRIAFLNTTMEVLCAAEGWSGMSNLPTHFYEYGTKDGSGNLVDLSGRKNSPTSTNPAYDPILTADSAALFTSRNVLGGKDAWDAASKAQQVSAPTNVQLSGAVISWDEMEDALTYVVLKDGKYFANTTSNYINVTANGTYSIKAANRFGGLGAASAGVKYSDSPTAIDNANATMEVQKLIRNGQLIIIRDGKTYNMVGQVIK